jgi:hypothetical protein
MSDSIQLRAPLTLSGEDVERALLELSKEVPSVSRAYEQLRGAPAQRAADELNQVLDIDVLELFTRAWTTVPRVRNAVQFSALKLGATKVSSLTAAPPPIIRLDQHDIVSTSYPVLSIDMPNDALPELRMTLGIVAHVPHATLTFDDGRIELLALGRASVQATIKYNDVLLKEHVTEVEGAPRDPFKEKPAASGFQAGIDFPV